jgi:competence protein ComEC
MADFNVYPFLKALICVVVGIVIGDVFAVPFGVSLAVMVALLIITMACYKSERAQSIILLIAGVMCGVVLVAFKEYRCKVRLPEREHEYRAVIVSEPKVHGKVLMMDALITDGHFKGHKIKASILRDTVSGREGKLSVGYGIEFYSRLEQPKAFHKGNFSYERWMRIHDYVATAFILPSCWHIKRISLNDVSSIERFKLAVSKFRGRLLRRYQRLGMTDRDYSVVAAMTLGDKSMLDKETKDIYSITGASHLLAVSGLHLGIIYGLFSLLFYRRRRALVIKPYAHLFIIMSVWAYAAITGLSPSVTRAALMITIYSVTTMFNEETISLNTLSLTALILLLINPLSLWDVSFQMSFMAMLGIFMAYKPLHSMLPYSVRGGIIGIVWDMTAVSIAAQLFTAPLIAYYFGRFSCLSLVTNLIAIPAATCLLYGALLFFLSSPFALLQSGVAKAIVMIAEYMNEALALLSRIGWASYDGINLDMLHLCLLYVIIGSAVLIIRGRASVCPRRQ